MSNMLSIYRIFVCTFLVCCINNQVLSRSDAPSDATNSVDIFQQNVEKKTMSNSSTVKEYNPGQTDEKSLRGFYGFKDLLNKMGISLHADGAFEAGSRFNTRHNDKKLEGGKNKISKNHEYFALYHQIGFALTIAPEIKNVKFGVHIPFLVTGKRSGGGPFNKSFVFFESKFGNLKLGAPTDAASALRIDGVSDIAVSGLGTTDKYAYSIDGVEFISDADSFLSSKFNASLNNSNTSESSRKITYTSPQIKIHDTFRLKLAISYLPDSSNTGAGKSSDDLITRKFIYFDQDHKVLDQDSGMDMHKHIAEKIAKGTLSEDSDFQVPHEVLSVSHIVNNAVSLGAKFDWDINEVVNLAFASTFEYGNSVGKAHLYRKKDTQNPKYELSNSYDLANLVAGGLGAELSIKDVSLGLAWHSWGKSFFNKSIYPNISEEDASTYAITGSAAYSIGIFKVSIAGIRSNRFTNIYNRIVIGTSCKLLALANMYLNLSYTDVHGKPTYAQSEKNETSSGWGWNVGLKVNL